MTLEVSGIRKSYRQKRILSDVSLTAKKGDCIGILGINGCGKSTLLSILAGVQRADGGSFLFEGRNLLTDSAFRSSALGYVPQGNSLIEELSAWDNLRIWYGKKALQSELSGGVLSLLGIGEFLKVPVCKMSGGMRKRLSIGCAVSCSPRVLLLDEPSAALDLACKEKIYNYLESFKSGGGIVLLATHDIQEVELCDRLYIMKSGSLTPYRYDGDLHHLVRNL